MSDERAHNYSYFLLPLNQTRLHGIRRILTVLILPVPPVHNPTTSFLDFSNTLYLGNSKYIFHMNFPQLFSRNVCIRSSFSVIDQVSHPSGTIFKLLREIRSRIQGTQARAVSLSNRKSGSNTAHCLRENKTFCLHSKAKIYSAHYIMLFSVTYESSFSSLCFKTLRMVSVVCMQGTYILFINIYLLCRRLT